jgi:beta-RFAP synthase
MIKRLPIHVDVRAPARLHLGFLDLNGGLGRRFGSLGLTIDRFETCLRAERSTGFSASGPGAARALKLAETFAESQGIVGGARLAFEQAIPDHAGLGSGTQLALAVGTALERLYGRDSGGRAIAQALQRGKRSGIGIGAFEQGGFIVDCGRGERDEVPPVALRIPFPDSWRFLLLFDTRGEGLHGAAEREAFARLPLFSEASAAHSCHLLLMKLVPGLLECRFQPVAEALGEIQQLVGQHFAPAQGGCFASPAVADALSWVHAQGLRGYGQSSWGPTGFVMVEDDTRARTLERDLKGRFGEFSPLRYAVVAARNVGATVNVEQTPMQLKQR